MQDKAGDIARLAHILEAISEIENYIKGRNYNDFLNDSMLRFACIKQLEIIGEAANHISEETRKNFSTVVWVQIIGMRNLFIHEYFGIDLNIAWEIIEYDIPALKSKIVKIIDHFQ